MTIDSEKQDDLDFDHYLLQVFLGNVKNFM